MVRSMPAACWHSMRATILLIALVLTQLGCRGARVVLAPAGSLSTRADTAAVLEAVWRASDHPYIGAGIRWLYLPDADSVVLTVSETVREMLRGRSVPASPRRPVGHDTVVYQVSRWTQDATANPLVAISSGWTHMSRSTPALCMSGGNNETYRVSRAPPGWKAERIGSILHGDGYCDPSRRRP